ncbi:hypothetical protein R1flu_021208 [Riccia fluitans]|uniref:Uncharacterized protein n=1 Tax=Riccia fluitans TaxID=41844 RepID=A0ABD1ZP14_9MARC
MLKYTGNESDGEDDDDVGIGDEFRNHLDALKRACLLNIGENSFGTAEAGSAPGTPPSVLEEDDDELFESIQKKYSGCSYSEKELVKQRRAVTISDDEGDDEDDEEILRSVEKLYGPKEISKFLEKKEKEHECADFPDTHSPEYIALEEVSKENGNLVAATRRTRDLRRAVSTLLPSNWNDENDPEFAPPTPSTAVIPFDPYKQHANLLSSAGFEKLDLDGKTKIIAEALQKNRLLQERMRSIASQVASKQRHNAEMQRRVKTLAEFEKYCKRRYAGFFTDQDNPSLKLFSVRGEKREASEKNEYSSGPPDNPDVEVYRKLKQKAVFVSTSRKWSADERRELAKGVKQQVYEVLVCEVMDKLSNGDLTGDNALEDGLNELRSRELTPQDMRDAIEGVNWDEIARVYVVNRTAEECRTRWLNHEDPLVNKTPWTKLEDKKLLSIAQRHDNTNWGKIAQELGTRRTPSECLTRYQRSLNASIMRSIWTPEEDAKLRAAVEELGESDWSAVAACLEGRNNSQCLMRWYKVLHPARNRKGRWSVEEDKRLKWAVSVYGAKKWKQIAEHVPGRTDIQCRERWCNVLDPDIKVDVWTQEEDQILRDSVARHGPHRWSAISADLKCRTDKQCWRRWKILFPEHQSDYRKNVFIQRNALVKNFQGRKKERPKLGPQDFVSKVEDLPIPSKKINKKGTKQPSAKQSSVQAGREKSGGNRPTTNTLKQSDSNRSAKGALQEDPGNGDDPLSNVDPKLRRLARIHKLKIARASQRNKSLSGKIIPGGAPANVSSTDDNGREQRTDLVSGTKVPADKRKRRRDSKLSNGQGKTTKRRRVGGARTSGLDGVPSDTEPLRQESQVSSLVPTPAETGPLVRGETSCAENVPTEEVTNDDSLKSARGTSRKRSRKAVCHDQDRPTKRPRPIKPRLASLTSGEREVQSMPQEPQVVGPGPGVLAFVDLISAVKDFCQYFSHVYEEEVVSASPDSGTNNTENLSGGQRSTAAGSSNDILLDRYPASGEAGDRPTVAGVHVSANGEDSGGERRTVPSIKTSGGACNTPDSSLNEKVVRYQSDTVSDIVVESQSNTATRARPAEENSQKPRSTLSAEDEEVQAATQAILSWPFLYGVQQLMHEATEFLDAKPPRRKSVSSTRRKNKCLDLNVPSQLADIDHPVTADIRPAPKRARSGRCRANGRGTPGRRGSDLDRLQADPPESAVTANQRDISTAFLLLLSLGLLGKAFIRRSSWKRETWGFLNISGLMIKYYENGPVTPQSKFTSGEYLGHPTTFGDDNVCIGSGEDQLNDFRSAALKQDSLKFTHFCSVSRVGEAYQVCELINS